MMIGHCCHCEYKPGLSIHPRICSVAPAGGGDAQWEAVSGWPGIQDFSSVADWQSEQTRYRTWPGNIPRYPSDMRGMLTETGTSRWVIRNITASIGETVYLEKIKITLLSSDSFIGYGSPGDYSNLLGSTHVCGYTTASALRVSAWDNHGPGSAGLPRYSSDQTRLSGGWGHDDWYANINQPDKLKHPTAMPGRGMHGRSADWQTWPYEPDSFRGSQGDGGGRWGLGNINYGLVQNTFLDGNNHTGHSEVDPLTGEIPLIQLKHFGPPIAQQGEVTPTRFGITVDTWRGVGHMWIKSIQIDSGAVKYNNLEYTTDNGTLRERWNNFLTMERMGSQIRRHSGAVPPMVCPEEVEIPNNQSFTVTLGLAITRFASIPSSTGDPENPDDDIAGFNQGGPDTLVITDGDLFGFGSGSIDVSRVKQMTRIPGGGWKDPVYDNVSGATGGGMAMFVTPSNTRFDPRKLFYRLKFFPGPGGGSEYPEVQEIDLYGDNTIIGQHGIFKKNVGASENTILLGWEHEVPYVAYEAGAIASYYYQGDEYLTERDAYWVPLDLSHDGEMVVSSREFFDMGYAFPYLWPYPRHHYSNGGLNKSRVDLVMPNPLPVAWDGISTQTFLLLDYHYFKYTWWEHVGWPDDNLPDIEHYVDEERYETFIPGRNCRYCEVSTHRIGT